MTQSARERTKASLLALGTALIAIMIVHIDTAASMVEIWNRSGTFAHGWVVAPISLWLVWRRRDALARTEFRPSYLGLTALALTGFSWMLAELASVTSVAQFSFVLMIPAAVITVLGWSAARILAFPLAFLLFAVPAGEFLIPTLMDWTATFTTAALRATGIPVYREGNHFMLPTGQWSVVEACSGSRYLAASLMSGTLYAYLTYRGLGRRLAFVGLAIVTPLVANWVRAYLIVMLGHLSGGQVATGVDHLIYGWIFFGIVIALMFWIGSFWRDEGPRVAMLAQHSHAASAAGQSSDRSALLAALMVVAVVAFWPVAEAHLKSADKTSVRLEPVAGMAGWRASDERLAEWSPRLIGARAYAHQTFAKEAVGSVGVYLAYYRGQTQREELVNSENVLVTTSDRQWRENHRAPRTFRWGTNEIEAPSSELVSRDQRLLARRFYWIDGRLTANDYVAKALLALTKLTRANDNSAVIVLYTITAEQEEQQAEGRIDRFAAEMGRAFDDVLALPGGRKQ